MQGVFKTCFRILVAFDFIALSNFCVLFVVISVRLVSRIADVVSLFKIIATSRKALCILSPTSTLGMLFLLVFLGC